MNKKMINILNLIISFGILCTAIIGFIVTYRVTRLQTSMNFCSTIYPVLQSEEFIGRERYLLAELGKQGDDICTFEEINNDTLKRELTTYCEYLNGIGIMVHEHMIDAGVIIPYIGVNSIYVYRKIKPYLDATRQKRAEYYSPELSKEENIKIRKAAELYFVHYELLVLEMEHQGPKWTKHFQKKIKKSLKQ